MAQEFTTAFPADRAPFDAGAVASPSSPDGEYSKVLALTQRLFPGPIEVQREQDPELPGHEYLVFNVVAKGCLEDIVSRDRDWHRELAKIALHSPNVYCLNIDVRASQ